MNGVFAAGDVATGETLVVKAMSSGREAAERVHEYLMNLEENHMSFYERYYIQNSYDRMFEGGKTGPPPEQGAYIKTKAESERICRSC